MALLALVACPAGSARQCGVLTRVAQDERRAVALAGAFRAGRTQGAGVGLVASVSIFKDAGGGRKRAIEAPLCLPIKAEGSIGAISELRTRSGIC